jgi:hypothetical protein
VEVDLVLMILVVEVVLVLGEKAQLQLEHIQYQLLFRLVQVDKIL